MEMPEKKAVTLRKDQKKAEQIRREGSQASFIWRVTLSEALPARRTTKSISTAMPPT